MKFEVDIAPNVSREVWGIFYAVLATIFLFGLFGGAGMIGEKIEIIFSSLFGIGRWLIPTMFLFLSIALFFAKEIKFNFTRNLGIFLLLFSLLGLIHLQTPIEAMDENVKEYGGWIGFTSSVLFRILFSSETSDLATGLILFGILLISLLITFQISFREIWTYFHPETSVTHIKSKKDQNDDFDVEEGEIRIIKPIPSEEIDDDMQKKLKRGRAIHFSDDDKNLKIQRPLKKDSLEITNIQVSGDWKFPGLDLLVDEISENYPDDKHLKAQAANIKEKLAEFGIKVEMVDARVGPTVTQFTMSPQEGIAVKKITSAKHDLALALSAKSIRIEAPIPGQPYVGIEIPNAKRSMVYMRELLESEEFSELHSSLRLGLGKDVSGKPVITDLSKMPHLLIAGATGSGKSVGMNSFLISLLYQNSPADLKFIMIDPKRVELTGYNGIPHLLTPVINDADKALAALKWAISEMMRRYQECSEKGYRNIDEYNDEEEQKMPKIVIVIDELADLMMRDFRKDTESAIMRLAQMARAVGIHLIIATQRPSVDVITGVIKANIPTRIAFSVMSAVDSRTILDSIGAEDLLGMGDMLYVDANTPKPLRIQGIFISSKEIERVTNHVKLTPEPKNITRIDLNVIDESKHSGVSPIDLDAIAEATNEDDLIPEAIEIIQRTGKASATLLQRMLSIGYARAAKILDILEKKGIVGPANGAKPRDIFLEGGEVDN